MKNLIVSLSVLGISFFTFCSAQTWNPLGYGINGNGCSGWSFWANCWSVYNNNVYVGGIFSYTGYNPVNCIAKWDGTTWDSLGDGIGVYCNGSGKGLSGGMICALTSYNSYLIAGGTFQEMNYIKANSIAQYNGTVWSSIGSGVNNTVYTACVYNGNLYVGGRFDSAGGHPAKHIAMWNGSSWSSFGTGVNNTVYTLYVYNGNLYVGGSFDRAGGKIANGIAIWNGTSWATLGSGVSGSSSNISAICSYKGNLYVGGGFDSAGGHLANNIAMWNGASWSALGAGITGNPNHLTNLVYSMALYNNYLYVGGPYDTAGGVSANGLAVWDGTNWDTLTQQLPYDNFSNNAFRGAYALMAYSNNLYVAGAFVTPGYNLDWDVAVWSTPVGINEISKSVYLHVYPNPCKGTFTIESSNVINKPLVEVYNVLGEKVYNGMLKPVQHDYEINLSSQPNGVYFYRVVAGDGGCWKREDSD